MDTRIGYPNEHLAGDSDDDIASPLFATAVGLVMDGLKRQDRKILDDTIEQAGHNAATEANAQEEHEEVVAEQPVKVRRSFLDKLTERVKEFLDNAE